MAWFRLFACGEDFPVIFDGNVELVGFYTTRYVEAETAGEAEAIASELLFEDEDLQPPPGYEEYQPRLVFEEVEQVAEPIDIDDNFSFFPMHEDDEDSDGEGVSSHDLPQPEMRHLAQRARDNRSGRA